MLDFIILALRVALVATLVGVCWRLYDRLPPDHASILGSGPEDRRREVEVRILLRRGPEESALSETVPIEIYSQEAVQARRQTTPEALGKELRQKAPPKKSAIVEPAVRTKFDEHGQAIVQLRPGRWWLRAALPGAHDLTWQLPIDVSARPLVVELTPENAYTREKSF